MKSSGRILILFGISLACALVLATALAQDTTNSNTSSGQATVSTEVKSAVVVYVSGNDLVVKTDDGQVKHFVVSDATTVSVDDKQLTVHDLQPGMRITRTITTTTTPKTITTVRTIKGKVWYVNPPLTVILTLPDGTNKQYKVPKGQLFEMNGEKHDVFELRKGMTVSATVLTETPEVVAKSSRNLTGTPPPPPPTPPAEAVLLIEEPTTPHAAAPAPAPQVAQATLPKTASNLPLIGLLGLLCLAMSLGLRFLRS